MINISFVANICKYKLRPTLGLLPTLTCLKVKEYLHVELWSVEGRPSNTGPSCRCVFLSANRHSQWHPWVFVSAEGTCYWVNYHSSSKQCFVRKCSLVVIFEVCALYTAVLLGQIDDVCAWCLHSAHVGNTHGDVRTCTPSDKLSFSLEF